jgi:flagellar assembly protein FliH
MLQTKFIVYPIVQVSDSDPEIPEVELQEEAQDNHLEQANKLIDEAEMQAATMISEAQITAEQLIAEARQQTIQLQDEAFNQGKALGFEEGRLQGYHETEALLKDASRIVEQARQERVEIMEHCEKDILELALAVATRVIHTEITINQDIVLAVVKDAIRKAKDQERVVIRVNPIDFETVAAEKQTLQTLLGREMGMDIRGDLGVDSGGCVIETDYGTIDARIDTQLDTVKKALLGMVKHG